MFYHLGRTLGRKALPAARKGRLIWQGITGDDESAWQAEQTLGREMALELRAALRPVDAPDLARFASEITGRLVGSVGGKGRGFHCELFREITPNAMALPGGWIFLSDGLVQSCGGRDDELAFIIAHEMAHVLEKHTWDRMISDAALRAASAVTARAGPMGTWLRTKGIELLRTAHSRDREFEADWIGHKLAAASAFGTEGAQRFLSRLKSAGDAGMDMGAYITSHPSPGQRMARIAQRSKTGE